MTKVLALNTDGELTYCSAPEENRGKGRCNHITHQKEDETIDVFLERVNNFVKEENSDVPDQTAFIESIIRDNVTVNEPNFNEIVNNSKDWFSIGKEGTEEYRAAKFIEGNEERYVNEYGDHVIRLTRKYEFEGRIYDAVIGEIPEVQSDGTLILNGNKFRFIPTLPKNKAGVLSKLGAVVVMRKDEQDGSPQKPGLFFYRDSPDQVEIYGKKVPIEDVENYYKTGDASKLPLGSDYLLDNLDPVVYKRFPNFKESLREIANLPPDEINDISDKRCYQYKDFIQDRVNISMKRMGITFRSNLLYRDEHKGEKSDEELDKTRPLFSQITFYDNLKRDLFTRSNFQSAETLNPIAALSQSKKVALTGPGTWSKDQPPYVLRMPHESHFGLVDSMDVSSGHNVGLSMTLSNAVIDKDGFIVKSEKESLSPSSFIPYRLHNDPSRAIMANAHMKQAVPITGGEDPIIRTKAWDSVKGAKLGTNLRVAYLPMEGNWEDAVVISRSAAERMTTYQDNIYETDTKEIKVGDRVERGQVIGGKKIHSPGIITSTTKSSITVRTEYKMGVGDKLAGRAGNKSVVSKILPDDEMPLIVENGTPVRSQVIMSPMSVIGRKNLGQVMEANAASGHDATIDYQHDVIVNNHAVKATAGVEYIMRLNHIAEKKIASAADELNSSKEFNGNRQGYMEKILMTENTDRINALNYIQYRETSDTHNKLNNLLKSIGVKMEINDESMNR